MKIFFALSYSSEVDSHGNIFPEFRTEIEAILSVLEADGSRVFCAPRTDSWKLNDRSPSEAVTSDLRHIDDSDVVLALLGEVVSAGVQLELGYALAHNKKILLASKEDRNLSYMNRGLVTAGRASLVIYESPEDLVDGLSKLATNGSKVNVSA